MFLEFEKTNMLKTHGNFLPSEKREEEEVPIPKQNSALKVFVVLKGIFRHLSNSELGNARRVNRLWNFAAMSELVSRRVHLSKIELHRFSSNNFRDHRDYGWYLEFENTRRSHWVDLYGTDSPILEFRHLHFGPPEKTNDFFKIFFSPWLSSVTSLTLSMHSETCEEYLLDWFLPCLPNLQNLSCSIEPHVDVKSSLRGSVGPDRALVTTSNKLDRQIESNLHSFSVRFKDACSFQWYFLGSLPMLQDLKLEFGDAATLIKCAEDIRTSAVLLDVEILRITLTRKYNLKKQVENAELNAEALAISSAQLCNQFRARQSLNVISMIPAAYFFDFLDELTTTQPKKIKFEIAVPISKENIQLRKFVRSLIPEILLKFPELQDLHLQQLQYNSETPFPGQFLSNRLNLDLLDPALQPSVKQLRLSTVAGEIESAELGRGNIHDRFLSDSHCQRRIIIYTSSWFQGLVELNVQVMGWEDCVEIIDIARTTLHCLKKLILRGKPEVYNEWKWIDSMYLFPEVDRPNFPKVWFNRQEVPRQYEGLPGIKSLKVFRVERLGIIYHRIVASEIDKKMPRLKLIQLDAEFNKVEASTLSSLSKELLPIGETMMSVWPSSIKQVKLRTNNGSRR